MKRHGHREAFQILLDPARARLLREMAAAAEEKPSQYIRTMLHWHLQGLEPARYLAAETEDLQAKELRRQEKARAFAEERKRRKALAQDGENVLQSQG